MIYTYIYIYIPDFPSDSTKSLILLRLQHTHHTHFFATETREKKHSFVYEIQCFEVLHKGNTVFDLLDARNKVKLLEDAHRVVHSKSKRLEVFILKNKKN